MVNKYILLKLLIVLHFAIGNEQIFAADGDGAKMFDPNPGIRSLYESKNERYFKCETVVPAGMIEIIYKDMGAISGVYNLKPPEKSLCVYIINRQLLDPRLHWYSMQYFTDEASMRSCIYKDYCSEIRTVAFMMLEGKMHRSYLVTSVQKNVVKQICIGPDAKVVRNHRTCITN